MTRQACSLGALALVSSLTAACIPRGDPPAGRQILADRNASLLELVPTTSDGLLRVLFMRPSAMSAGLVDLWAVSVDANGDPLAEQLVLVGIGSLDELSYPLVPGRQHNPPYDARGRVYANSRQIDLVTGQSREVGTGYPVMSPSLARVLVKTDSGGGVLYEIDNTATALPDASDFFQFAGETLFYLTTTGDFMRFAPGGSPERLATDVGQFSLVHGGDQKILLTRADMDPNSPAPGAPFPPGFPPLETTSTLLDTTTLQETPLPSGPSYGVLPNFSPDGHWVVAPQYSAASLQIGDFQMSYVLVDVLSGTVETLNGAFLNSHWRPGHDELWASGFNDAATDVSGWTLWIKKPGQPMVAFPALNGAAFTDDGTYFFSTQTILGTTMAESDLVGLADNPTGPRFPLVPPGSSLMGLWTFSDDRLFVQSLTPSSEGFEDYYLQVVDPGTGAAHLFGEHGIAAAVGQTRVLGILQTSYERGDLTTYDLPSDQTTILAPEFAMAAVTEPQGTDAYPPGGRVVYQYRARFDSPWDGLWLARVP